MVEYGVEYSSNESNGVKLSSSHDSRHPNDCIVHAFTIDPKSAINLDDALSIHQVNSAGKKGCKVYEVAVHIVNAAKHITKGTDTDREARSRGISTYGGKNGKVMHMISNAQFRKTLSLLPDEVRDVISVTCKVTSNSAGGNAPSLQFGECEIKPAQIKSAIKLTYQEAQYLLDDSPLLPGEKNETVQCE